MGNKSCTIGIRTNETTYVAGSTMTGTIYLSIATNPQKASTLNLRIIGEETTIIHCASTESLDHHLQGQHHRDNSTQTYTLDHYERSKSTFLSMDYPISKFGATGMIPPGQYEYPFEIMLPSDLPSTMDCTKGQSHCNVTYSMTAYIVHKGGFFSSTPKASQQIRVEGLPSSSAGAKTSPTEMILEPEVIPVNSCCCFGKGTMTLGTNIDKSTLSPQETVNVYVVCKNDYTVEVTHVKVSLEEEVHWRANGYGETFHTTADEKIMGGPEEMPELRELNRVKPRYVRSGLHMNAANEHHTRNRTTLVVPSNIRDPYSGNSIYVHHRLTVTLVTKGGCCTTNPEYSVRVFVHRPPSRATRNREAVQEDSLENEYMHKSPPPYAPTQSFDLHASTNTPLMSAPPQEYDEDTIIEADLVLPSNWSAQTADVVAIPMASATFLENTIKGGTYV